MSVKTRGTSSTCEFAGEIADRCKHGDGDRIVWSKGMREWTRETPPPDWRGGCAITACERCAPAVAALFDAEYGGHEVQL